MTWTELAQDIARQYGHTITADEADFFLWERTPFPVCGLAGTRAALHREFVNLERGAR